jgi:hypothetical protein
MGARLFCACALLAFCGHAAAQGLVKCVDADGNVTYQDSPCAPGQAGRAVELPKAETKEDTGAWEAAARDARVVKGMPKRWVLRARGAPIEIRPGGAKEDATEVWRYATREGSYLVGFAGPNVTWTRDEAGARPAAVAPPAAPASGNATRGAQNRRFVLPGRYCEHVFAEIGAADREETVPPAAGSDAPPTAVIKRYTYEPQAGDPSMRTVFSCVDGKVADVERTVVR